MDVEVVTITPYFLAPVNEPGKSKQCGSFDFATTFILVFIRYSAGDSKRADINMAKAVVVERDDTGRVFKVPVGSWATQHTRLDAPKVRNSE